MHERLDLDKLRVTLKQALSLCLGLVISIASGLMWVGAIQAKVSTVIEDQTKLERKVDKLIENTNYIKGAVDELRRKK